MNIDTKKLQEDLIEYFSTAINPFAADLLDVEAITSYSETKLVDLAKSNGFNIDFYRVEEE